MDIFTLVGRVTLEGQEKVQQQLSKTEETSKKVSQGLKIAGAAFTAVGAAGLALIQSTKAINAQLGVTALNLGITTKEMRDLTLATTNVTFPIKEVMASFDLLARAGVKDVKVLKDTATAFDTLGDATGHSASQVTEMMIPAMKTFGLSAGEMAKKTDMMTYMSRKSTMSLEDFNTMVGYTTPQLVEQGLTIEELTASLIYMEKQGYAPGRVMTREFMKATTLAQKENISLAEALGMTTLELEGYKEELAGATGMSQEYADVANKQFTIMDKLRQKWSELTLQFGTFLQPLEPILAGMTALGPMMLLFSTVVLPRLTFTTMAHTVSMVAQKVATLAVTVATKAAAAAQWLWNAALSASPIGAIALAVGLLAGIVTAVALNIGKAAAKTEEYTSETVSAWLATKNLTESLTELERVTRELTFVEKEIARVEEMLGEELTDRAEQSVIMTARTKDETEATKEATKAEYGRVYATEGLTAANIAHAETLAKKTKLTEADIHWLKIYRGAILANAEALKEEEAAHEAAVRAQEEHTRKYEDFMSIIEGIAEEYDHALTEAGKLEVSMEDLINYMKLMGRETELSAMSLEDFAEYGDDVNLWAKEFGVSLEDVAYTMSRTTDDMLRDINDLARRMKDSARDATRVEIDAIDDRMDAHREAHQERMDALRDEYNETIKTINAELSYALSGYQSQIEAIDKQIEDIEDAGRGRQDFERKAELEASIAEEGDADRRVDLEERLNELIIESGNEKWRKERELAYETRIAEEKDADERRRLEQQLADMLLEIQTELTLKGLEIDKDTLRQEMDMAREAANNAKDQAQETYDRERELQEEKHEKLIEDLQKDKEVLDEALQERLQRYDDDLEAFQKLLADETKEMEDFVAAYNAMLDQLKDKTITITTVYKTVGAPSGAERFKAEFGYEREPAYQKAAKEAEEKGHYVTFSEEKGYHTISPEEARRQEPRGLQVGGVAMRETIARIGEEAPRVPEGVLPLTKETFEKLGLIGGGTTININIAEMNVRDEDDADRMGEAIVKRIELRTGSRLS